MVRYLFYTIGDLTYQSPLVFSSFKTEPEILSFWPSGLVQRYQFRISMRVIAILGDFGDISEFIQSNSAMESWNRSRPSFSKFLMTFHSLQVPTFDATFARLKSFVKLLKNKFVQVLFHYIPVPHTSSITEGRLLLSQSTAPHFRGRKCESPTSWQTEGSGTNVLAITSRFKPQRSKVQNMYEAQPQFP